MDLTAWASWAMRSLGLGRPLADVRMILLVMFWMSSLKPGLLVMLCPVICFHLEVRKRHAAISVEWRMKSAMFLSS